MVETKERQYVLDNLIMLDNLKETMIKKREKLGLTVRELGVKSGVSYTVIYDFEIRGIIPKLETLLKIANSLDLSLKITLNNGSSNEMITPSKMISSALQMMKLDRPDIKEIINFINFKMANK